MNAINHVRGWWSTALEGNSEKLNDIFSYRHGDFHYSKHQVTEMIPYEKIVWTTLESKLSFVEKQNEWDGTIMTFQIAEAEGKTQLTITHFGLIPECECYQSCSKGWTYYLQNSLLLLITTGQGKPDRIQ